jgi:hypothetical protein
MEMNSKGASFQERFEREKKIRRQFENNEIIEEVMYPDCVLSFL